MRAGRTAATRTELLRARRRLERVEKGAGLLRRKREALVAELFRLARPAVDAREAVEEQARLAYPALAEALAVHGRPGARAAAWPLGGLRVRLRRFQVWGIAAAEIDGRPPLRRALDARGGAPGYTGTALAGAAGRFEVLADLLLDAAPREMLLRRLGAALTAASRQVRALEERVAPDLERHIRRASRTLQERERDDRLRLRHFLRRRRGSASR